MKTHSLELERNTSSKTNLSRGNTSKLNQAWRQGRRREKRL